MKLPIYLKSYFILEYYQLNIDQFIYNLIVSMHAINQFLNWQFKWININSLTHVRNWITYLLRSILLILHVMIPKCKSCSCDSQHYLMSKSKTTRCNLDVCIHSGLRLILIWPSCDIIMNIVTVFKLYWWCVGSSRVQSYRTLCSYSVSPHYCIPHI